MEGHDQIMIKWGSPYRTESSLSWSSGNSQSLLMMMQYQKSEAVNYKTFETESFSQGFIPLLEIA